MNCYGHLDRLPKLRQPIYWVYVNVYGSLSGDPVHENRYCGI